MRAAGGHDAIVIGAGIVGAACAAALAHDGMRVLVLEADFAAGGTTAAGMGHLVVMDDSPAQLALTAYSMRLWRELAADLPARVEHDPCGTLWIADDDTQLPALAEKKRVYATANVNAQVLDGEDVRREEPELRAGLAGALLVPGDAVIYAPATARVLLDRAKERGMVLREGARVDEIRSHAVRCGGETIEAPIVVNATGAAAPGLTPGLPVVPRKGHLVITDRYPEFCRHQIVELGYLTSAHTMSQESVAFNVQPRATGQVLIGSSRELAGWNAAPNLGILRRMLDRAIGFMPGLASLSAIRTWTGFRPATPDSLPLIGAWEKVPGLWIAAGHEGLGITTALATAQIVADQIAGRDPAIDVRPFAPTRAL
jgi:D-hydroxyproline dehydrogenase subunit beta